jgi:1-acyl-sn-glycerol-3-phosphate acyltransferase
MIRALVYAYYCVAYYGAWLVFGLVGLALNVGCTLCLPFGHTPNGHRRTRTVIRILFDLWLRWLHFTGIMRVTWRNFPERLPTGTVYIANHPSLIDATVLLARLPNAICIFKPALARNPAIGPAARLADYAAGDSAIDVVRDLATKLRAGCSLLIFPEGSRTGIGTTLRELKPGFALIAGRAGVPVQLILIRTSRGLVRRGTSWWRLPAELPARVVVEYDRQWEPDPNASPLELSASVAAHLQQCGLEPVT